MKKICRKCGVPKEPEDFYKKRGGYSSNTCKICETEANKIWQKNNKEATRRKAKNWRLKHVYKITPEEIEKLREVQENKCAICNKPDDETFNGNQKGLVIDHCHKTGKVRGLLCYQCNHAVGMFKDSQEAAFNAYMYLKRFYDESSNDSLLLLIKSE